MTRVDRWGYSTVRGYPGPFAVEGHSGAAYSAYQADSGTVFPNTKAKAQVVGNGGSHVIA